MNGLLGVARNRDCKRIPDPTEYDGLPPGEWVLSSGIRIWVEAPKVGRKPVRPLRPCGTLAAYRRHLKNREVPCDACAEASRVYSRRQRGIAEPMPLMPHGTHAAFTRHYTARTEPCDDCWAAERVYQRDAKRRRRAQLRQMKATAA